MNEARRRAVSQPDRAHVRTPAAIDSLRSAVECDAGLPPRASMRVAWRLRRAAAMGLAGGLTGLAIGAAINQFGPEVDAGASSAPQGPELGRAVTSAAVPAAPAPPPGPAALAPSTGAAIAPPRHCCEPAPVVPASSGVLSR